MAMTSTQTQERSTFLPRENLTHRLRIFNEYSRYYFINKLLLMGRILNGIFLRMQLFVMFLFHFFLEYSKNILQVRPHPLENNNPK